MPLVFLSKLTPRAMARFFNEEVAKINEGRADDYAGKPVVLETIFQEENFSAEKVNKNIVEVISGLLSKRAVKNIKAPAVRETCKLKKAPVILFLSQERIRAVKFGREIAELCPLKVKDKAYVKLIPKDDKKTQTYNLKRYINIVTGTPRRVLDHLQAGSLNLTRLKLLLIDGNRNIKNWGFMDVCRESIRTPFFEMMQIMTKEEHKSYFKISVLKMPEEPKKKKTGKKKKAMNAREHGKKHQQEKLKRKLEAHNQNSV